MSTRFWPPVCPVSGGLVRLSVSSGLGRLIFTTSSGWGEPAKVLSISCAAVEEQAQEPTHQPGGIVHAWCNLKSEHHVLIHRICILNELFNSRFLFRH